MLFEFRLVFLVNKKLATIEANSAKNFYEVSEQARVVDRTVQCDMSEVSWTGLHTSFASIAETVFVHDTHSGIVNCMEVRLKGDLVIDECAADFSD